MRGRRIILMLIISWRSTWRSFHCGWWEMLNVPLHKAWMVLISVCQKDTWFMSERRLFLEGFCVSGTMEQDLHNNTQKKFPKVGFLNPLWNIVSIQHRILQRHFMLNPTTASSKCVKYAPYWPELHSLSLISWISLRFFNALWTVVMFWVDFY